MHLPADLVNAHVRSCGARRCFPCTRDLVQLFLTQSADIVMAADYDGYPDFWKEPWFPPVCPSSASQLTAIGFEAHSKRVRERAGLRVSVWASE